MGDSMERKLVINKIHTVYEGEFNSGYIREKLLEGLVIALSILFTAMRIIRLRATHLMQIRKISFTWQRIALMIYVY